MSASKVAHRIEHSNVNGKQESLLRNRALQDPNCGQVKDDYTPTDAQSINSNMVGKKVVVTFTVSPSPIASCTLMFCENDPCCNSCSSYLLFGEVELVTNEGVNPLGCYGNECNWQENCTYNEGDLVTVYAKVALNYEGCVFLAVDEHCSMS